MVNEFHQPAVDIKKLEYKDRLTIKKLDEECNYDFYIPPFELREDSKSGIDWDLVNNQNYIESSKLVGTIHEIVVAICPNDPFKASDTEITRVHKRVMDGRTRYLSSKKAGIKWPVKYIKVTDFEQFMWLWSHFNSLKGGNVLDETNKFLQLCIHRNKGGMEKDEVGRSIVRQYGFNHPFNRKTLLKRIHKDYKMKFNKEDSGLDEIKREKKNEDSAKPAEDPDKKKFKKDREITRKDVEINDLNKQNFELKDQVTSLAARNKDLEDIVPFLTTPQTVKVNGSDLKISVHFDMEKREIIASLLD